MSVEFLGEIDLTDERNEVTLNGKLIKPGKPGESITIKDGDVLEGLFSTEKLTSLGVSDDRNNNN